MPIEQRTTECPGHARVQRGIKRRDNPRRNWCRRFPFSAPSVRCPDNTIRSGRCGGWVLYLLPGGKQCRRPGEGLVYGTLADAAVRSQGCGRCGVLRLQAVQLLETGFRQSLRLPVNGWEFDFDARDVGG
jgi:hypothetical protein